MVSIKASREINASLERVWEIVSDVDKDAEYWKGISAIKNTRKEENLLERTVKVGFMGNKGYQIVKLSPNKSIELTMTSGPLKGSRLLNLCTLENGDKKRVDIVWDFQFSGVPNFARGFVKGQIEGATEEALDKIARAAEEKVALVSSN